MDARWSLRRLETAVEGFATQLQCPICLCAYDNPVSLPCNHCFCEECIHRALELKQMCPICKLPAKKRRLRYDQMIRQLLAATELLCAPAPPAEQKQAEDGVKAEEPAAMADAVPTPPPVPPQSNRSSEAEAPEVVADSEQQSEPTPTQLSLSIIGGSSATSNASAVSAAAPGKDQSSLEAHQSDWLSKKHEVDDVVADSEATGAMDSPPTQVMQESSLVPEVKEEDGVASQANAEAAASAPAAEVEALPLNGPFYVGDLVEVTDRAWAGVNKPGGTARITGVNNDGTYGVKYVIGTRKEHSVHDFFIHRPPEEFVSDVTPSRAVKKRQRRSVAESPLSNGRSSTPSSDKKKRAKKSVASATQSPVRSTPGKPKRSDMVILCSGFEDADTEDITKRARQLGADVVPQWSSSVTHLIAKCVRSDGSGVDGPSSPPSRRRPLTLFGKRKLFADSKQEEEKEEEPQLRDRWVKTRSLKYLKAITAGRWIVSEHWLQACVEKGDRVDEAPFEADGHFKGRRLHDAVRRARLAREANLRAASPGVDPSTVGTQLFSGFCFHIVGEFLPPMPLASEVDALLRIGGGKIILSLDDISREMRKDENRGRRLVVVCDKINPHTLGKEIRRLSTLNQLQNPAPEAIVNYHWVINSISDAKLREFP